MKKNKNGYIDDILGKQFGYLKPYKRGPNYISNCKGKKNTSTRVWCYDSSFPGAPDRLVHASSLRRGETRGLNRPHGSGSIRTDGYKSIKKNGKFISEHRQVMADYLGRELLSSESVHHRGDRADNKIELLVLKNRAHGSGQSIYDQIVWLKSLGIKISFIPSKLKKIWKD